MKSFSSSLPLFFPLFLSFSQVHSLNFIALSFLNTLIKAVIQERTNQKKFQFLKQYNYIGKHNLNFQLIILLFVHLTNYYTFNRMTNETSSFGIVFQIPKSSQFFSFHIFIFFFVFCYKMKFVVFVLLALCALAVRPCDDEMNKGKFWCDTNKSYEGMFLTHTHLPLFDHSTYPILCRTCQGTHQGTHS